ncbi:MAG: sugar ABC transporter ATP-binding protein [Hyphomicrobiales bacterium]|nr:sugar ABC transporter ATP-binding protein [Hyphomicrobiales bacterium]
MEAALSSTAAREAQNATLVLQIDGLHKSFGGVKALDNVRLAVRHGEVHGLLGQNGSGKSTLIKILSGFHDADGQPLIMIDGRRLSLPIDAEALRRHRLSFVHQHLGLLPSLTVLENLLLLDLAVENRWLMDWRAEARRARELFERYALRLDPLSPLSRLSPVERAQLAIVRAFDPLRRASAERARGLLILDEPTPFLPAHDVEALFKLIREIVADGASVIFVSHDIDEVLEITDRATVLRDGRVAGLFETAAMTKAEVIRLIVGRHVDLETMRPPAKSLPKPSLSISGLSGGAVGSFSVDLRIGEVVGLTGLIGSGYSDVIYMTFGATPARSGTLDIAGDRIEVSGMSPVRAIGMGCILIPGDRLASGAVPGLTVCDNVNQPVLSRVSRSWALSQAALVRNARLLADRFDVRPRDPTRLLSALSGGNQQKALLAKWLQTKPRLILLDEPTQGVDVGARAQVFEGIAAAARSGASILCASSDYEQLTAICDRVLVFNRGAVTEELIGDKINKSAIAQACYRAG